jgi:hypothetical protein
VTFGWWAKYAAGEKTLDRERKNELRAWAGLPELPPSVGEAVAEHTHPDAAVYQVGAQVASRVVLIGADVASVDLRINGNVGVAGTGLALESHQAACNGRYTSRNYKSLSVRHDTWQHLNTRRLALGLTWDAFLAPLENPVCDPIDKP